MTSPIASPSDETLQAFDRGLLSPDEIDAVTRWLEAHPEAEKRLCRLANGPPDAAVEALRKPCALADELSGLSDLTSRIVDKVLAKDAVTLVEWKLSGDTVPKQIRDYQLLRPLGRGGMGSVYVARHTRLQRDVALKLLAGHAANDQTYRARFEREMAVVGQLDHPHLIRAHDAGAEGSHLFLVMELLDGCDLARLIANRGPLSLPDACEVVRQVALGLHHAHDHGLVHRDIKPANLFLTSNGVVKVIDLGLARVTTGPAASEGVSTVHTVMGTPECMAPEQWENSSVDHRADLYSLGCVLFILLTGDPPLRPAERNSWVAWMDAHRWKAPPDLRERLPDVPAPLAELTAKLLAKDPKQRPSSALETAEALAPWTVGHSLSKIDLSLPTTRMPRSAHPNLKLRRRRVAIAAVLLLVTLALPLIWFFTRPSPIPKASSSDAAPSLLLTALDHVELADTADMLDLNGAFTVEMWVHFDDGIQYFVGDEIWPASKHRGIERSYGWVLRIQEDQRMNITIAGKDEEWFRFEGPTLKFDDQWHHIALSKNAKVLRVFLDGNIYLTADTAGVRFLNSPLNLFLGPNNTHLRSINCSFRGFRVSSSQLYEAPFVPAREFSKTGDTLLLLDFSVGAGISLPDLSGKGRHGVIVGGRWLK
jgi:serine/threonine protein kinase